MTPGVSPPTPAAPFEPRIVGFMCNWCAYASADKAGTAQKPYPTNVRIVRLMCTGRMDAQFVLKAFDEGADGVIVLGCHPGDCHYKEQNFRMFQRHRILQRLLAAQGINPERCRMDFVAASQGERFAQIIQEAVEAVRRLGPLVDESGGPPQV